MCQGLLLHVLHCAVLAIDVLDFAFLSLFLKLDYEVLFIVVFGFKISIKCCSLVLLFIN